MTAPQRWWLSGGAAAVLVLFIVVLVVTGFGEEPPPQSTTTPPPSSRATPSTSTTSTTTTPPGVGAWPLTGLPIEDGSEAGPILAVKIDNSAKGRPQAGLELADMVFDIPVEGGISRLLALYQSHLPDQLGPVRSVREVDPKLLAPFGASIAHSGGVEPVIVSIREVAVDLGEPILRSTAYWRAGDRPAPYDLMLDPAVALATVEAPSALEPPGPTFADPGSEDQALSVEISSSNLHQVEYGYSEADGGYLRFQRAQPHETASGDQIVATNVVVLIVEQLETGRTDSSGAPVPDFQVTGGGDAVVFRDGVATTGRWERDEIIEFFRFLDEAGNEISLAAGATWIHLVPEGRTYEWR